MARQHRVFRPEPFTCVICDEHQDTANMGHWNWPIPPMCRSCESGGLWSTGYGVRHRFAMERAPDKRIVSQLRAISQQLHDEAKYARP